MGADRPIMSPVSPRHRLAVPGLVSAAALTISVIFALRLGSPGFLQTMSDIALACAALGAGAACVRRGRLTEVARTRSAWLLLGSAAGSWGVGQTVLSIYEVGLNRDAPFPSLADVGYLLALPLFASGLLRLAVPTDHLSTRLRALLDGLLVSSAVLLTSWVTVLGPVARAGADNTLGKLILLAYPVGDVVMVTLVAYVVLRTRATGLHPGVPLPLIGAALTGLAVADSGYAYLTLSADYASGNVIDAGWLCGYTALFLAAWMPSAQTAAHPEPETRPFGLLLPYMVITVAVLTSAIVTQRTGGYDGVMSWIRTSMIVLMVVRQVLTLIENSRLTRHLEERVADRTRELHASQQRFEALVEHSSDVVALVDRSGHISYASESSMSVLGYSPDALVGCRFTDLVDERSQAAISAAVGDVALPLSISKVELRLRHARGHWLQVETTVTNLLDEPSVNALVLNTRDVSERRELEQQLTHQAFHDSLTGLANRSLFAERVGEALRRANRRDGHVAVLFLDLDGFKEVNDSLGHSVGDMLLRQVADRLRTCVRAGDMIARLGGDEFAVLAEDSDDPVDCLGMAERIHSALRPTFLVEGNELHARTSIGIATADSTMLDPGQLIRNADLAMYRAKAEGEGSHAFFDPEMHSSLVERLELERDLRHAVAAEQIVVHYQPIFDLTSGSLIGAEALVRWEHPQRGVVAPNEFISIAEQNGLIHQIGALVLRSACEQSVAWRRLNPDRRLSVSVNISGRQLQREAFVESVADILDATGVDPTSLVLEITESVLMDDAEGSMRVFTQLKNLGVRLAIDDFGTGYSSLSYLHRFPVDILKIDRSFIDRLGASGKYAELVQSIVQLGQTMRLVTIAEGVEDHRQLLALRRLGCELAQGFHFGRPEPGPSLDVQVMSTEEMEQQADLPKQRAQSSDRARA